MCKISTLTQLSVFICVLTFLMVTQCSRCIYCVQLPHFVVTHWWIKVTSPYRSTTFSTINLPFVGRYSSRLRSFDVRFPCRIHFQNAVPTQMSQLLPVIKSPSFMSVLNHV